jgi:hypothetical protein
MKKQNALNKRNGDYIMNVSSKDDAAVIAS